MRRSSGRWAATAAVVVVAASGCANSVAGTPAPAGVVGVTQHIADGPYGLDVGVLAVLDPAPVDASSRYGPKPDTGTRLVAARFRITNRGARDALVGPTGQVKFTGEDGKDYDDSLVDTEAGPMFDQLSMAPGETVVGWVTAELPEQVKVASVAFGIGFGDKGPNLRWKVLSTLTDPPPPARRADSRAGCHRLGEQVSVRSDGGDQDIQLSVGADRIIDPAPANSKVRPGNARRLVGVEFSVRNTGPDPFAPIESDADLRIFAVLDAADQAVNSHVYGASAAHGLPLAPGAEDTWTLLFEVPTDFKVDRISFTPRVASGRTTTLWAAG